MRRLGKYVFIENGNYFTIYVALITIAGLTFKKVEYKTLLIWYFVSMVAFSSAIANQYLIIPILGLCICKKRIFYWLYCSFGTVYCFLNGNELNLLSKFASHFPFLEPLFNSFATEGGILVTSMMWT